MKDRDILILCQFFYPEYNSSSTLPTELAEDLVRFGFSVDVLCGYPVEYYEGETPPKRENHMGIHIRRLKYIQLGRTGKLGRLINYFSFMAAVFIRWPVILRYKCILVYSNPPLLPLLPAVVSLLFGIRFVFIAFDVYPHVAVQMGSIGRGSLIERVMNLTNRLVYARASMVVALGTEMKDFMLDHKLTKNVDKISVIPNWCDRNKVSELSQGSNTDIESLRAAGRFIVLYSGNMGICQDMDTIIRCAEEMQMDPRVLFVFIGHGTKVGELKAYAQEKGLQNVRFFGFLKGNDFAQILHLADCFLLSLEQDVVGMGVPSKAYSYLAVGRPILAIIPEITDIAKVLKQYNAGCTLTQGDVDGLADAIKSLVSDPERCTFMGENARRAFGENYERQMCTGKYFEMLRNIIGKNPIFNQDVSKMTDSTLTYR